MKQVKVSMLMAQTADNLNNNNLGANNNAPFLRYSNWIIS